MTRAGLWCGTWAALALSATSAAAQRPCPSAAHLPQLTIDEIRDPAVPVIDRWQIFWRNVPLSDAQLAMLAQNDPLIELTREEMGQRGSWVYMGMLAAAAGTAISCVGWVLFGQETNLPQALTLGMALGGLGVGAGGVFLVTESIQAPLEPHLAPTPRHRLTREQARQLVATLNRRLYEEICEAADAARP